MDRLRFLASNRKLPLVAVVLSLTTFILAVYAIFSFRWVESTDLNPTNFRFAGLWYICSAVPTNLSAFNCCSVFNINCSTPWNHSDLTTNQAAAIIYAIGLVGLSISLLSLQKPLLYFLHKQLITLRMINAIMVTVIAILFMLSVIAFDNQGLKDQLKMNNVNYGYAFYAAKGSVVLMVIAAVVCWYDFAAVRARGRENVVLDETVVSEADDAHLAHIDFLPPSYDEVMAGMLPSYEQATEHYNQLPPSYIELETFNEGNGELGQNENSNQENECRSVQHTN